MVRLKDRHRQIPGGLKFLEPATKWQPQPWSSFDTIVDGLVAHRRANPYLAQKHGWKLARTEIENEVDQYNALICQSHGWDAYVVDYGGTEVPKIQRPRSLSAATAAVVAGANIIKDMFGEEGPIRDKAKANARALVCVSCPKNAPGDWTRFFTVPAQAVVRKMLGIVKDLDLKTDLDDQLHVCEACGCPLKGKVFARIKHILKHIPAEDKAALWEHCWILKEEAQR